LSPIAFDTFAAEVTVIYASGRHAPGTLVRMKRVLADVGRLEGVRTTADLTTATMARYVASRGPQANTNTTNGYLDYLRAACSYAVEEGYLDRPPTWARVRPRRAPMRKNPPLSYPEAARLLGHLEADEASWEGHRLYALVATVVYTGLRRDEALYLMAEDIDLEARTLAVVPRRRLKTERSARAVGMPEVLAAILASWTARVPSAWLFPGVRLRGPWTGGMPGSRPIDRLREAAKAAGVASKATWHGLRHTFGTHALRHFGQPLWVVQRTMGHTDLRTTQRYLHLDDPAPLAESVRPIAYRDSA
jgi:integrase